MSNLRSTSVQRLWSRSGPRSAARRLRLPRCRSRPRRRRRSPAYAGEWYGEYSSAGTGRRGTIRFFVDPTGGVARGEVVMTAETHPGEPRSEPVIETLAIRLVTVRDGLVSGALEPYRDPVCDCLVSTSFTGELRGDLIEGGFVSFGGAAHVPQSGRWRVAVAYGTDRGGLAMDRHRRGARPALGSVRICRDEPRSARPRRASSPPSPERQGLEEALAALRAVAAAGGVAAAGQSARPEDRRSRPGGRRAARSAAGIRGRARSAGREPDRFEDGLDAAVRSFQGHHGLAADGVVGRHTWAELETHQVSAFASSRSTWRAGRQCPPTSAIASWCSTSQPSSSRSWSAGRKSSPAAPWWASRPARHRSSARSSMRRPSTPSGACRAASRSARSDSAAARPCLPRAAEHSRLCRRRRGGRPGPRRLARPRRGGPLRPAAGPRPAQRARPGQLRFPQRRQHLPARHPPTRALRRREPRLQPRLHSHRESPRPGRPALRSRAGRRRDRLPDRCR